MHKFIGAWLDVIADRNLGLAVCEPFFCQFVHVSRANLRTAAENTDTDPRPETGGEHRDGIDGPIALFLSFYSLFIPGEGCFQILLSIPKHFVWYRYASNLGRLRACI